MNLMDAVRLAGQNIELGCTGGAMDTSREFGTKELRDAKVAEVARKYSLPVDAFFEIRALVDGAYECGERNGRMCLQGNQSNEAQRAAGAAEYVAVAWVLACAPGVVRYLVARRRRP